MYKYRFNKKKKSNRLLKIVLNRETKIKSIIETRIERQEQGVANKIKYRFHTNGFLI